jgi:hypothetical protein
LPIEISVPVSITGLDLGQDQLPAPAPRRDHDFTVEHLRRQPRVLDLDHALLEIHHQPLFDQRVDPDHAFAAQVAFQQRGDLQIPDSALSERQLVDHDAIDAAAGGHAVQHGRRAGRQLQVARDPLADDRSVGAAVDQEAVGAAAIDLHLDGHARVGFAGVDVLSANGQRIVDLRRRKRRHF